MQQYNLSDFTKGWFVGNFVPSLLPTPSVEVAIKRYTKGDREESHYHKIATEITVVVDGKVSMNGREYQRDDVLLIEPGESTNFIALEDTTTCVVKLPCVVNDKYIDKL